MKKRLLLFAACALVIAGCAKRQTVKPQPQVTTPPAQAETKEEPSVRFTDWQSVPQLNAVHFDYDRADLTAQDRATLQSNAEYLKNNPDLNVLVEGHCDERGTTEYNLALGQKRAMSVRDYYGQLGVPLSRIATISYGKEMPVDPGHNEDAWAKNRRAETKVRSGGQQ